MININPNIASSDFDRAIEMLESIRDHALDYERDARTDDPLADFSDGLALALEFAEDGSHSPDALAAMMSFISNIDPD